MEKSDCRILLNNWEYKIDCKELELVKALQKYCQKVTERNVNVKLKSYDTPDLFDDATQIKPKIGIEINPESNKVTKLQVLSLSLDNAILLEGFDGLTELDLRNNKLKNLPVKLCDSLYNNKAKIYVYDNLIPEIEEKGAKTSGLFTSCILNEKYSTIDYDLFKNE